MPSPPCQNESFVNTSRKLLENRNQTLPVACYSTRKPEPAPDILRAIVDTPVKTLPPEPPEVAYH